MGIGNGGGGSLDKVNEGGDSIENASLDCKALKVL